MCTMFAWRGITFATAQRLETTETMSGMEGVDMCSATTADLYGILISPVDYALLMHAMKGSNSSC